MVDAVPGITAKLFLQTVLHLPIGMDESPFEIFPGKSLHQMDQFGMYRPEVVEGQLYRGRPGVKKLRPALLIIGFYQGTFLGQGPFETGVAIVVTVRYMMDQLSDGPTPGAIWTVQLFLGKGRYQCQQTLGKMLQYGNPLVQLIFIDRFGDLKFPNGVTEPI